MKTRLETLAQSLFQLSMIAGVWLIASQLKEIVTLLSILRHGMTP